MSEDEFWRERLNRLEREQGYAPGGVLPADRLAYVTSRPASQKRFYKANPAAVLGPEVEGGVPVFDRDTSAEMLVYPVAKNPFPGDHVVVSEVPYRRVSEGAGDGIANPKTMCLIAWDCRGPLGGGCTMPGIVVNVTGPDGREYSGVTDEDGGVCFVVDGLGTYTVANEASGYWAAGTRSVNLTFSPQTLSFIVQPVSGRVCSVCNAECPDPYPLLATVNFTAWETFVTLDTDPESPTYGQFINIFRSVSGTATWTTSFLGAGHLGFIPNGWGDPDHPGFASRTFSLEGGGASLRYVNGGSGALHFMSATSISCRPYAASFGSASSGFSFSE